MVYTHPEMYRGYSTAVLIGALDKTSAFQNECLSAVKCGLQLHLHVICGA